MKNGEKSRDYKRSRKTPNKLSRITFEVSALKDSPDALVDHFEVKFSQPVNGQWLYEAIEKALKKSIQSHAEPDEKQIEEFVRERAKDAYEKLAPIPTGFFDANDWLEKMENFILVLLSQAPISKPRVDTEWVSTLINLCVDVDGGERRIEDVYEWLTERGIKVENFDVDESIKKTFEQLKTVNKAIKKHFR